MNDILRLLNTFEVWIYILIGLVGFFYLRKFILALKEWHGTIFGLERDNAQRRLNEAATVLVLSLLIAASEFLLTTFVIPTIPGLQVLNTPTLNVLSSPTGTLMVISTGDLSNIAATGQTQLPGIQVSQTETMTPENTGSAGCIAGKIQFTSPKNGDQISGLVNLKGVISVPDFGFYKYEYSQPGSNTWITIAAGNQINPDGDIGSWNVSLLVPGDYLLHIIVYNNEGQQLPPCEISVNVVSPPS